MKKLALLLSVILLFSFGCAKPQERENTPTTVTPEEEIDWSIYATKTFGSVSVSSNGAVISHNAVSKNDSICFVQGDNISISSEETGSNGTSVALTISANYSNASNSSAGLMSGTDKGNLDSLVAQLGGYKIQYAANSSSLPTDTKTITLVPRGK